MYKESVYDLHVERVERLEMARVRSVTYANLVRGEFAIRERKTGHTSRFEVTYGLDGALAGVPVQLKFQPNWWLRVELDLDETTDVPPDPAADAVVAEQIDDICLRAVGFHTTR